MILLSGCNVVVSPSSSINDGDKLKEQEQFVSSEASVSSKFISSKVIEKSVSSDVVYIPTTTINEDGTGRDVYVWNGEEVVVEGYDVVGTREVRERCVEEYRSYSKENNTQDFTLCDKSNIYFGGNLKVVSSDYKIGLDNIDVWDLFLNDRLVGIQSCRLDVYPLCDYLLSANGMWAGHELTVKKFDLESNKFCNNGKLIKDNWCSIQNFPSQSPILLKKVDNYLFRILSKDIIEKLNISI